MIQKIKNFIQPMRLTTTQKLYREWDKQRSKAMTPSERSEIDAIFARHI